jgi:gamma-glutamyltranspeptidase/glutathione hydrolase
MKTRSQSRYRFATYAGPFALFFILIMSLPLRVAAVPVEGHKMMYAGPSPYAAEIARSISLKGGNVVDASVAIALSLAVTHPYYASFGGGGFALIKMQGKVRALDFRETAPAQATPELFTGQDRRASIDGGLAVGTPGVVAGLWTLHHEYGKLKWNQLFETALNQANHGFRVSGEWVKNTTESKERLSGAGRKIFFKAQKGELKPGELLLQPELAKLLALIKAKGPAAFYEGPVAQDLVQTVAESHGILSLGDLKKYKTRWLEPLIAEFAGHKIFLMPPPSSGGVVIAQALHLIEKLNVRNKAELSSEEYHLLGEIMKLSYRGRATLGDPDFAKNPIGQLLGEPYLNAMAALIKPDTSINVEKLPELNLEKEETTHFVVADADGVGDAVTLTVTLNGDYGSGLVSPKFGIALNNQMDDFTTHLGQPNMFGLIQGAANQVRAGARPLSSMSPTLVEKEGRLVLALGAPGGPRIISGVLQVLYRFLSRGNNIDWAIQAPRVHHQFLPDKLFMDRQRFSPEVIAGLKARGHILEEGSTAKVYGVSLSSAGILSAAFDSRGEGAAGGY